MVWPIFHNKGVWKRDFWHINLHILWTNASMRHTCLNIAQLIGEKTIQKGLRLVWMGLATGGCLLGSFPGWVIITWEFADRSVGTWDFFRGSQKGDTTSQPSPLRKGRRWLRLSSTKRNGEKRNILNYIFFSSHKGERQWSRLSKNIVFNSISSWKCLFQ